MGNVSREEKSMFGSTCLSPLKNIVVTWHDGSKLFMETLNQDILKLIVVIGRTSVFVCATNLGQRCSTFCTGQNASWITNYDLEKISGLWERRTTSDIPYLLIMPKMPKIFPEHNNPICKLIESRTHRSPCNEPIIWHHINPRAKMIHYSHRLTDAYVGHQFYTFMLDRNSSQETYMKTKH
jgi:hypothetical protein